MRQKDSSKKDDHNLESPAVESEAHKSHKDGRGRDALHIQKGCGQRSVRTVTLSRISVTMDPGWGESTVQRDC
jgi:hypothetical protein